MLRADVNREAFLGMIQTMRSYDIEGVCIQIGSHSEE